MAAPKKKAKREVKSFFVEIEGIHCNVVNDKLSDYEMIGVLTILLDAYKQRFQQGGGASDAESNPGERET